MFRFQTGFRAPVIVSRDGDTKGRSPSQSFHGAMTVPLDRGWRDGTTALSLPASALCESSLCPGSVVNAAPQGGTL